MEFLDCRGVHQCRAHPFSAAQKIMIARRSGIDRKMELAKTVAGISKDKYFESVTGKDETAHWDEVKKKIKEKEVQIY